MVDIFKSLAEESRLRILAILMQNEMCVCEIEECLKMTQSNASRHLTALRQCGILDSYKKAQWVYYKINEEFKEKNPDLWSYLIKNMESSPAYQADYKNLQNCRLHDLCGENNLK